MLGIFTHCLQARYGGTSGLGSMMQNVMIGLDQLAFRYQKIPEILPKSYLARQTGNRFLNEQYDFLRLNRHPDIDHILLPNYYLAPIRPGKIKTTVIVHDTQFADMPELTRSVKRKWLHFAFGRLLRHADNVVFISQYTEDQYFRHFKRMPDVNYCVIPNAIDESVFCFRKPEHTDSEIPTIIAVASFAPHKNYETFIRIADRYRGRARFVSIGKPPKPEHLERLFRIAPDTREKISAITFTGYLPREEMIRRISEGDVFLHPSHYEGFGLPPVEATALGVPVIAGGIPPMREILPETTRFVDNPDDVDAWCAKLDDVLNHYPDAEDRRRNSDFIRSRYSRTAVAGRFIDLISSTRTA